MIFNKICVGKGYEHGAVYIVDGIIRCQYCEGIVLDKRAYDFVKYNQMEFDKWLGVKIEVPIYKIE